MRRAIVAAALAALLAYSYPCFAAGGSGAPSEAVVFAAWNVRNYSLGPQPDNAGKPGKTADAADAVAQTIAKISPDIVGLCEIGSRRDLEDLTRRLEQKGLALGYSAWVDGPDEQRHLALLSRFPVVATDHDTRSAFAIGGRAHRVQRGFLDCTVEIRPGFELRVLGAHLKSRRIVPDFEQAEFRRHESLQLRRRIGEILDNDPATPLLVFGDMNDTKDSPVVSGLLGRAGSPGALVPLALADKNGDTWTYRWAQTDEYSRVDYVMVSRALRPLIDRRGSRIHMDRGWKSASDHRPLVVTFKLPPAQP